MSRKSPRGRSAPCPCRVSGPRAGDRAAGGPGLDGGEPPEGHQPPLDLDPAPITDVGGTASFVAHDAATGDNRMRSDGTPGGTVVREDFPLAGSDGYGSIPQNLADVGGSLFFAATNADPSIAYVEKVAPASGAVSAVPVSGQAPFGLTGVGGKAVFQTIEPASNRDRTAGDGTAGGTLVLKAGAEAMPAWVLGGGRDGRAQGIVDQVLASLDRAPAPQAAMLPPLPPRPVRRRYLLAVLSPAPRRRVTPRQRGRRRPTRAAELPRRTPTSLQVTVAARCPRS